MGLFDKGGSQTTKIEIPEWMDNAARDNVAKAGEISKIGYVPYYGPDVAALQPSQVSAMNNNNNWAAAFGMAPGMAPQQAMPTPENFAGGVRGYSSAPLYEQAIAELAQRQPDQYAQIKSVLAYPNLPAHLRPDNLPTPGGGGTPAAPAAPQEPQSIQDPHGRAAFQEIYDRMARLGGPTTQGLLARENR